jgi:hypothetical protein
MLTLSQEALGPIRPSFFKGHFAQKVLKCERNSKIGPACLLFPFKLEVYERRTKVWYNVSNMRKGNKKVEGRVNLEFSSEYRGRKEVQRE